MKKIIVAVVLTSIYALVSAHSGGTDIYGCHIDHSTGLRHCH
jgi:hypothetical protein